MLRAAGKVCRSIAVSVKQSHRLMLTRDFNIGIIGSGSVGVACASSLLQNPITTNIFMCDSNTALCEGEVMDLEDESFLSGTKIQAKRIEELNDSNCDIIVITAGCKQVHGESRTDLIGRNALLLNGIIKSLGPINPKTILLLVANPVDILTALAEKWTSQYIPSNQVIGSGTYLDSKRLCVALSKKMNISPSSVNAYVIGEHGDSQVVPRSIVRVGGCTLTDLGIADGELSELERQTRKRAYEIISRKGYTSHGIGQCVAAICENILEDRRIIMTVTAKHPEFGTHLGWPVVLGRSGIQMLLPVHLTEEEREKMKASATLMNGLKNTVLF